jgi:site-specific recombinase XerD
MATEHSELLDLFLDSTWAERGLSRNTLRSYRYDLMQLAGHQRRAGQSLAAASREDLLHFLAVQLQSGRSPPPVLPVAAAGRAHRLGSHGPDRKPETGPRAAQGAQ